MAESQTNEVRQRMLEEKTSRLSDLITRELMKSDAEVAVEVRQLLKDGACLCVRRRHDGPTLLYVAISRGLHDTVEAMLESPFAWMTINSRTGRFVTPLSKAYIMEDQRMIYIIENRKGKRYTLSGCYKDDEYELELEKEMEGNVSELYGARMKLRRNCPHGRLLKDCSECKCRDAYDEAIRRIYLHVKVNRIDDWDDGKDHEYMRKPKTYDDCYPVPQD